jgi:multidrug efflux pump subunit AcrA (membrane-fusion protein)
MKAIGIAGAALLALTLVRAAAGQQAELPAGSVDPDLARQAEAAAVRDRAVREADTADEDRQRAQAERQRDAAVAAARETERAAALDLERALSEAQAFEEELFRIHRNPETSTSPASAFGVSDLPARQGSDHDPRIAARAAPDRELPLDIFDRSNEVIPPGT